MSEEKKTIQEKEMPQKDIQVEGEKKEVVVGVGGVKSVNNEQNVEQKKDVDKDIRKVEKKEKKQEKTEENFNNEIDEKVKMQTVIVKGKKKKKTAPFLRGGRGQAHIKATYNNTIVSISDLNGAVLVWGSAGKSGFKGPKKSTPYAAGIIVKSVIDKAKELGIKEVDVFVKGVGTGREAAVRALDTNGLKIVSIKDVTPIPHGGCRPRKKRRV